MLEKIVSRRRRGQWKMRCLGIIIDSMDMSLSRLWEMVKDREARRASVLEVVKSQTRLSNWTTSLKPSGLGLSRLVSSPSVLFCTCLFVLPRESSPSKHPAQLHSLRCSPETDIEGAWSQWGGFWGCSSQPWTSLFSTKFSFHLFLLKVFSMLMQ